MNRASLLRRASALLIAPSILAKLAPASTAAPAVEVVEPYALLRYANDAGPLTPWIKVPVEQINNARTVMLIGHKAQRAIKAGESIELRMPVTIS